MLSRCGNFEKGVCMIYDTDVLIWCFRGNERAAKVIDAEEDRRVSVVSLMELHQGTRNRSEQRAIRSFLRDMGFVTVPINENISQRACIYVEEFWLKASMQLADALITATSVEQGQVLCTANRKHYKVISELMLKVFRPA